jgi:hypothetical protein
MLLVQVADASVTHFNIRFKEAIGLGATLRQSSI